MTTSYLDKTGLQYFWDKLKTYVSDAISGIKIGGRNLLRNTGTIVASDYYLARSTISNGIITLTPTSSASYAKLLADYLNYSDYENKTVTFSADIRLADVSSSYTTSSVYLYVGVCTSSTLNVRFNTGQCFGRVEYTDLSSSWQRLSGTFTIPDSFTTRTDSILVDGSLLTVQIAVAGQKKPVEARNLKLEIGNKSTDWTPSPEDSSISEISEYLLTTADTPSVTISSASYNPNRDAVQVFLNGLKQIANQNYTISNGVVNFSTSVPANNEIEIVILHIS